MPAGVRAWSLRSTLRIGQLFPAGFYVVICVSAIWDRATRGCKAQCWWRQSPSGIGTIRAPSPSDGPALAAFARTGARQEAQVMRPSRLTRLRASDPVNPWIAGVVGAVTMASVAGSRDLVDPSDQLTGLDPQANALVRPEASRILSDGPGGAIAVVVSSN